MSRGEGIDTSLLLESYGEQKGVFLTNFRQRRE
jgi:hypothetical protein